MSHLADFILRFPKSILVSFLLLTIAGIYPALQIQTEFSLEGFFPRDDENILAYQDVSEEFGNDDNAIIIAIRDDQLFSPKVLTDIKNLTASLAEITHIKEIRSLTNVEEIQNQNDMLIVEPYLNGDFDELDLNQIKNKMLDDPFIAGSILSANGQTSLIAVFIEDGKNSFTYREEIISELDEVVAPYITDYELRVTGIPYFRNQYVHTLNSEIIYYVSISSILIIALLWFLFRNIIGVVIPISIVWLTILLTTTVLSITGGVFEVLSSTIAPILLCVGIADSVHMLTKYNDTRLRGLDNRSALKETIIVLGSATFLTSITTAIGFGTLITSNVVPMQRFGGYTAIGVMLAFFITIFLLPSILMLIKTQKDAGKIKTDAFKYIGLFLRRTHRFAFHNHKTVVIATLLFTTLVGLGITQLRVNSYVFDDIGQSNELMQDSRFVSEHMGPQFPFELVINSGEENGITEPNFLNKLDSLDQFLNAIPEVHKTTSLSVLMKEIHKTMNPDIARESPLPDNRPLAAQYLLLFELTGNEGLESLADFNYERARVGVQSEDAGSFRMNQIREEVSIFVHQLFPDKEIILTGTTMLVASLTANIVTSLAYSIILAFVFISIIMAFLFRNKKLVLISLLPNIIPLVLTAGVMGYLGIDIKPSTAVIFTIAFGIAIDDSIHFLARFRIETLRGKSLEDAVRITTEKTGRAIILTSAILLVGFGVLGTSQFESTQYMGLLTCLTIFNALLADLLFLPALIHWLKPELKIRSTEILAGAK